MVAEVKIIVIVAIATAVAYFGLVGWTATGPNCPGMDPAYLGWCD